MAAQPEEVLTVDKAFVAAKRTSFVRCTKDKPITFYLKHWANLEDLRTHGYDIMLDATVAAFTNSLSGILPFSLS
ncbi:uncharacterized protein HKW66_Vig0238260 [Vigna angularis]|uniref:Uncharacterized protein n=1 Tax=Phaseolus angularis TaxID=3914 RepID=A0A8T0KTQ5_PHAAN|nr:uncharacterized protein HKW66_Vig0238260 [Vigna angularis]